MRVHSLGLGFLLVCLVFLASFCNAADDDHQTFEIVGVADCADCQYNNFNPTHAFSGLHVTIDCKLKVGEMKRVGDGELDEGGKFKIPLPKEVIQEGHNIKKCYVQLHNAAAAPCPAHDGLDTTAIVFKSQNQNKITFGPQKALRFSTALCTSKLLWPLFEYPPLPKSKTDPWKKTWPKITIPPLKDFGQPWSLPPPYKHKHKPLPPPVPIYKPKQPKPSMIKPLPPAVPIYKPPTKPLPPPVPIYKPIPKPPQVPIYKPLPLPVPIYKPKPKPPPVPIYKPIPKPQPVPIYKPIPKPQPVPIYKPIPKPPPVEKPLPPPVPVYEPPVVTKPLPPPFPIFPHPPLYKKKPCPPFSKIPLKYFNHPKFGYFPKLPPFDSNP